MNLNQALQNIGLSDKEAKIYLALLKLKNALPSTIAATALVKRPTTYLILEQLVKKGLAGKIKKGSINYYQPVTPHTLVEDQYRRYHDLEGILPELLQLHKKFTVTPQISLFEGKKGMINIMEDSLRASTEILCWADVELATHTILSDYYPTYIKKKVERGIWLRGIFSYSKESLEFKKKSKEELREVYLISKEDFPFSNEINIYDNKISIISHADEIGIIIENENIANTQRSIFNFAFKYAKIAESELRPS